MKKGDFIKIEFVGTVSATGEIFDLTSEELAKKEGIHNPEQKYGPVLIIVGANIMVPGVEKQVEQMNVGEEREFDVKPSEGFGHRKPEMMRIISITKFFKEKMNPVPGMFVNIDGMQAKVQAVSGGRVRVDFNHPLASRELHYKIKIVATVDEPLERTKEIAEHFKIKCETELTEGVLTIKTEKKMPQVVEKILEGWIKEWVKEIKEIKFATKEEKTKKDVKEEAKDEIKQDVKENEVKTI